MVFLLGNDVVSVQLVFEGVNHLSASLFDFAIECTCRGSNSRFAEYGMGGMWLGMPASPYCGTNVCGVDNCRRMYWAIDNQPLLDCAAS